MQEIPIYLFTGFMDSGKTTLIKETLLENGFADQGKSLIICCEDGEVEYDEAELKKINASLVMVENEEDFTADFLNAINMKYLPDQVFIEYNGTWEWIRSPRRSFRAGGWWCSPLRPWMRPPLICILPICAR